MADSLRIKRHIWPLAECEFFQIPFIVCRKIESGYLGYYQDLSTESFERSVMNI